jgi:hypothetical protein
LFLRVWGEALGSNFLMTAAMFDIPDAQARKMGSIPL